MPPEADQIKILMVLIGVLWALVMRMVWHGYANLAKKVDILITNQVLTDKDVVGLKAEVAGLREWRHTVSNEEHTSLLRELRKRNGGGEPE